MQWLSNRLSKAFMAYPLAMDRGLFWGRAAYVLCHVLAYLNVLLPLVLLFGVQPSGVGQWLSVLDYGYVMLGTLLASLLGFAGFAVLRWSAKKFKAVHAYAPDYVVLPLLAVSLRVWGDYVGTMLILLAGVLCMPGSAGVFSGSLWAVLGFILTFSWPWLLVTGVSFLLGGRLAQELVNRLFHHVEREMRWV